MLILFYFCIIIIICYIIHLILLAIQGNFTKRLILMYYQCKKNFTPISNYMFIFARHLK